MRRGVPRSLVWVSRNGNEQPVAAPPRLYQQPRLSPDGTRVAVTIVDQGNYDMFTLDLARDADTPDVQCRRKHVSVWTPDRQDIV